MKCKLKPFSDSDNLKFHILFIYLAFTFCFSEALVLLTAEVKVKLGKLQPNFIQYSLQNLALLQSDALANMIIIIAEMSST